MRLLIFLLALMSAFFISSIAYADDGIDYGDLKSAKIIKEYEMSCNRQGYPVFTVPDTNSSREAFLNTCIEYIKNNIEVKDEGQYCPPGNPRYTTNSTSVDFSQSLYEVYETSDGGRGCRNDKVITYDLAAVKGSSEQKEICPPDNYPNYTIPVERDGGLKCAKPPEPTDCSAGYHSKAVSKALGSAECVPKDCPPAGSGEALYTSPNLGSSFSGGGMYCNDGCAYSVSGPNITSDKHATGTSQGAACGDKPYDNKKLADQGDSDKCSTSTNDEVTILSCDDATPTNDTKDPLDNDDSKTGDDPTPDKPKEICADGDTVCNLKNLEIQMQNSTQQTIDNQNELHNKQVDVQTKNTQAIIDSIDGLDTSIYLQTQQDERLHAVTVSKFNELIGAVNGIENGGGGSGGGNGSGNGNGEPDCEGSAADCVPIEGSELPVETVNLEQYADKYDDWLPNAELPDEKCIVLTTGKSICLSFEAFILLFKAISGLLVIGALMHSAKIISGAI